MIRYINNFENLWKMDRVLNIYYIEIQHFLLHDIFTRVKENDIIIIWSLHFEIFLHLPIKLLLFDVLRGFYSRESRK